MSQPPLGDDPARRGAPPPEAVPATFPEPRSESDGPDGGPPGAAPPPLPRHPTTPPTLPRYPGGGPPGGAPPVPPPGFAPSGPPAPPAGTLASYGQRVGGFLLDAVILLVVGLVMAAVTRGAGLRRAARAGHLVRAHPLHPGVAGIVLAVVAIGYGGLFCGSSGGQTPGMMVAKIRCVDAASGGPVGIGRGLARALVAQVLGILFFLPLVLDLLWPAWDPRRQTLHDKAVGSVVVRA